MRIQKIDRGYATRSEVRLSLAFKKSQPFVVVTTNNFLLAALDHQYAINGRTNYVSSTDDVAEPLNQSLYARVIDPTVDLCNS